VTDTYVALGKICSELWQQKIIPIIIGGSHDLTYGQYLGYAQNDQVINMAVVDEKVDIYKRHEEIDSESYLYRIFTETPNYLFNFSQIGYQSYFVSPEDMETLERLYFDFYRLGKIRENFEEVESVLRDADLVSVDISSVRQSDAPAKRNASPHGFFGEEACQISRYAGISDKVTSFGIYEINPEFDRNGQTAHLAAQMIWYFIDGFYSRMNEYPIISEKDFVKYMVNFEDHEHEMTFWKSRKSGRWWMQVPVVTDKYERHQLVPCTYADYQMACKEEIPERWLRAYEKIS
jgi:arginase family enzyme